MRDLHRYTILKIVATQNIAPERELYVDYGDIYAL